MFAALLERSKDGPKMPQNSHRYLMLFRNQTLPLRQVPSLRLVLNLALVMLINGDGFWCSRSKKYKCEELPLPAQQNEVRAPLHVVTEQCRQLNYSPGKHVNNPYGIAN